MKWPTFTLRALCGLTVCAALFCAGYRLGLEQERNARVDYMVQLNSETTGNSSRWMDVNSTEPNPYDPPLDDHLVIKD